MEEAIEMSSKSLESCSICYPEIVSSEKDCSLIIDKLPNEDILFIEKDGKLVKRINPEGSFVFFYFEQLHRVKLQINIKALRVMFIDCCDCNVLVNNTTIGPVELFRCEKFNFFSPSLPMITAEEVKDSNFVHTCSMVYILKMCVDLTIKILHPTTGSTLFSGTCGKLFWDEQEQTYLRVSEEGMNGFPFSKPLNSIAHYLFQKR